MEPVVDELGLERPLERLRGIVDRGETGADRQREVHEQEGSLRDVALDIAARTPP